MVGYYSLLRLHQLHEINGQRLKKQLHEEYMKGHKGIVRVMDIAMILILLFNIGAIVITHALVIKAKPDKQILEANPMIAKTNNLATTPEANKQYWSFVLTFFIYSGMIIFYIYNRINMIKDMDLWSLIIPLVFWIVFTGFDFFNNFGYLAGKIIYG